MTFLEIFVFGCSSAVEEEAIDVMTSSADSVEGVTKKVRMLKRELLKTVRE